MGFSRQEHWSGLPWPPPGDLPNPGIECASLTSPSLAGRFVTTIKLSPKVPSSLLVIESSPPHSHWTQTLDPTSSLSIYLPKAAGEGQKACMALRCNWKFALAGDILKLMANRETHIYSTTGNFYWQHHSTIYSVTKIGTPLMKVKHSLGLSSESSESMQPGKRSWSGWLITVPYL